MLFLANENIPLKSILLLRKKGYDVVSISEESPGISDIEVMERAKNEQRMLLTFDRDYGELIYKRGLKVPPGLIYFRFVPISPEEMGNYFIELLNMSDLIWKSKFTTIERGRIRQRPLP